MPQQIQVGVAQHAALAAGSLPAFISTVTARYGSAPAFTCLGHSLGFDTLERLSDRVAAWLQQESGLAAGDRVALQLPNLLQYPVLALGILKAGMVLVNVNPLYTPAELQQQLRDSAASLLVVLADRADCAAGILAASGVQLLLTRPFDLHPAAQRHREAATRAATAPLADAGGKRQLSLRQVLWRGALLLRRCALQRPTLQQPDLALLQYTGGTTGVAKAAMLSHGNLLANVAQLDLHFAGTLPPAGAVMVVPLPLYHIYAFTLGFLNSMAQGHHVLLIPDPRDLPAFMRALQPYRISGFVGINTLYRQLCQHAPFAALDFSGLRLCGAGGMALAPEVAQRWKALTGCDIVEGYGLSECSPVLASNTASDLQPGTVGRVLPGTALCLLDAAGQPVAPGQPGEICVQGPQVMQGYWRAPAENAQVFDAAGWFHTGDVGVLDAQGCLRIVDRIKDVIIVSGFKVYPNELEAHVCRHPQVSNACAVGIGDASSVQVKLFVVSKDDLLTAAEIIRWCRLGLAPYKVPRQVEFRPHLPLSNVGKVLRKELRAASGRDDHHAV